MTDCRTGTIVVVYADYSFLEPSGHRMPRHTPPGCHPWNGHPRERSPEVSAARSKVIASPRCAGTGVMKLMLKSSLTHQRVVGPPERNITHHHRSVWSMRRTVPVWPHRQACVPGQPHPGKSSRARQGCQQLYGCQSVQARVQRRARMPPAPRTVITPASNAESQCRRMADRTARSESGCRQEDPTGSVRV